MDSLSSFSPSGFCKKCSSLPGLDIGRGISQGFSPHEWYPLVDIDYIILFLAKMDSLAMRALQAFPQLSIPIKFISWSVAILYPSAVIYMRKIVPQQKEALLFEMRKNNLPNQQTIEKDLEDNRANLKFIECNVPFFLETVEVGLLFFDLYRGKNKIETQLKLVTFFAILLIKKYFFGSGMPSLLDRWVGKGIRVVRFASKMQVIYHDYLANSFIGAWKQGDYTRLVRASARVYDLLHNI